MLYTKPTRKELKELGYSRNDVDEILSGIKKTTYTLPDSDGKEISEAEAVEILGRDEWVRGLCRSAFYAQTTRLSTNNERVSLHTKNYIA